MTTNQEPLRGNLTKKFFLSLPDGVYLVSNIHPSPMESVFAEMVVAKNLREHQWRKIVEVGANSRLCYVFDSIEDHHAYFNEAIADMLIRESENPEKSKS